MKGFSILIIAGLAVFSTVGFNDRTYANAANLTNSIAANTMQVQDTMVLGKAQFSDNETNKSADRADLFSVVDQTLRISNLSFIEGLDR